MAMGKVRVEVCLISARGLRRTSSLWKLQWFAVGWIDADNKYCTKIDASGNANPVWKTKFSALVDPSEPNFQDMALHVEVYSREPVFLRERLYGTATVILKEFLERYLKDSDDPKTVEEVGSFQLRKKNSNKPQGFVDISIRISEEREESSSHQGDQEGFKLMNNDSTITLDNEYGPSHSQFAPTLANQPGSQPLTSGQYSHPLPFPRNYEYGPSHSQFAPALPDQLGSHPQTSGQYTHPLPYPRNYSNLPTGPSYAPATGTSYQPPRTPTLPPPPSNVSYQPPRTPPPPPPPSNVGYIPTFLPRTDNMQPSYINMPSSGPTAGYSNRPGFGMGLGAGALAAGAMIFGDDFMSGFDFPPRFTGS